MEKSLTHFYPQKFFIALEVERKKKGLSRKDFSSLLGVHRETYGDWFNAPNKNPQDAVIVHVLSALGYASYDDLIHATLGEIMPMPAEVREEPPQYGSASLVASIAAQTGVPMAQVNLVLSALAPRMSALFASHL